MKKEKKSKKKYADTLYIYTISNDDQIRRYIVEHF